MEVIYKARMKGTSPSELIVANIQSIDHEFYVVSDNRGLYKTHDGVAVFNTWEEALAWVKTLDNVTVVS